MVTLFHTEALCSVLKKWMVVTEKAARGFLKNRHACFELSHTIESSLRSLSTL